MDEIANRSDRLTYGTVLLLKRVPGHPEAIIIGHNAQTAKALIKSVNKSEAVMRKSNTKI